jgi:anti-sigma regulatory factor (Ser/Thr protein kinase)
MGDVREFEARVDTVGAVRSYVRDSLLRFGCTDEAIDAAVLCTSELATNALVHSDGAIGVDVELGATARITVHDRSRRLPVLQQPDPADTSGRGLLLVSTFAHAWGIVPETPGKGVWFEIDLREKPRRVAPDHRRRSSDGGRRGIDRP